MRVLVTFAVVAEFGPWRSRHAFVPYEFNDSGQRREFDLFRANIGVSEVTVLLTGMGRENVKKAMSTISLEVYDVLISTGLAGALDLGLNLREVVVGRIAQTLDHSQMVESEAGLISLAIACGARAANAFLTSDTIATTADEKRSLNASGSLVEMETSHILAIAGQWKVPAVGVRAISDAADEDLPLDFDRIADSRGKVKVGGLLMKLALHPHLLPLLVRFGRQCRSAAGSLADFLDQYIPAVERQWRKVSSTRIEEVSTT
jgi:adenosylhomocysteine nucleosidase